jgi:hypothetical protein
MCDFSKENEVPGDPRQTLTLEGLIAHFSEQEPDYGKTLLWAWIPVRDDFGPHDDVARGYVVVSITEGDAGVMVFGRYGSEWKANPWSSRPVVKRLLGLCGGDVYTPVPA